MDIQTDSTDIPFSEYCLNNGVKPVAQDRIVLKIKNTKSTKKSFQIGNKIIATLDNTCFNLLDDPLIHNEYCRDGQNKVIRDLKQNKYHVTKVLDLHNYKQNEALVKLETFINDAITPGNSCLKVIHGKGLNSPDGKSVLKSLVRRFLEYHPRLLAYTSANANNGGDGVTLIKLKN